MISLDRLPHEYAVARLDEPMGWPVWATWSRGLLSITRREGETSVVCEAALVPATARAERGLAAYVVRGPLEFTVVGVLSRIAAPLAAARVPIFAISTFDTDVVLVHGARATDAESAWREAGLVIASG